MSKSQEILIDFIKLLEKADFKNDNVDTLILKQKDALKGEKGIDGYTPQKGIDYFLDEEINDWINRVTPIKGIHYFDGKDGKDGQSIKGERGESGKDGKDIDPQEVIKQVIEEIKKLKGKDRLSLKNLKDTEDLIGQVRLHSNMMKNIPKSLLEGDQRWHGGGITSSTYISNEAVSGSVTSWVLVNLPVLGTVQLYGQGQRLSVTRGDYTISGKNITTTNPWNAGDLEASYILFGN